MNCTAITIKKHCVILMLVFGITACGQDGHKHREWTEDVVLEDGSTIQVNRTVAFNESNSWSGDSYNAIETEATIAFTGDLAHLPPWNQPLMALVMYQDKTTKEWVVVATSTSCEYSEAHGNPNPPYWEYHLTAQGWQETPLSLASIGRPANLFSSYQRKLETRHITVADRQRMEVSRRPFSSMSPIERSYRVILAKVEPYNC